MVEEKIIHFQTSITKDPVRVFFGAPGWVHIEVSEKFEAKWWQSNIRKTVLSFTLSDAMQLSKAINILNDACLKGADPTANEKEKV